ncbi:MAG: hypothetical protein M2R45_04719 [Verrucomicrobia subdivision 3 bacterium]|nr:hypothetical protein [Limisphaerales bacterium]MCS1416258.1 hypothetical protein [Limisphaerales bacterium]
MNCDANRCLTWAWVALCIYVPYATFFVPMGNAPRIKEIVFVSISLFFLFNILACSLQTVRIEVRFKKTVGLLLFVFVLLNLVSLLHWVLQ